MSDPVITASPAPAGPDAAAQWRAAMAGGKFERAWAVSDAVLRARDPAGRDDPALPYHRRWLWDGRDWRGRPLLVRCYHGLGDALMAARFLPRLRRQAGRLILETPPALLPLLGALADRAHGFDPAHPLPPMAVEMESLEIPHALRVTPAAAAAAVPFLAVPPAACGPGRHLGLCATTGGWDPARDLPPAALVAACAGPGRVLHWLQPGAAPPGCANPEGAPACLAATASLVAAMDLVICPDTMLAHLAAALGRPALVLVRQGGDWRWLDAGPVSPWAPRARLLRQERAGDWSAPLARLGPAIARMLAGGEGEAGGWASAAP